MIIFFIPTWVDWPIFFVRYEVDWPLINYCEEDYNFGNFYGTPAN